MSENKTNSSPKLSEMAQRLIEERESKPEEEKSLLWDTSLYDLENDPELFERWKAEYLKYLEAHPEEAEKIKKGMQKAQKALSDLAEKAKEGIQSVQVSLSDWPAFPKERLFESPFAGAREAWEFYRRVMEEDEVRGWNLLKEHEQWYSDQIKAAEKEAKKWKSHREMRSRIYLAKIKYFVKRLTLRRFTRKYMMFLTVPGELSQEEAEELSKMLPITGYHAPEYARDAYDILQEYPSISSFSKLASKMEEGGNSKVDTIKKAIGYTNLPREKKTFGKFKKLLFEKVRLMENDEIT